MNQMTMELKTDHSMSMNVEGKRIMKPSILYDKLTAFSEFSVQGSTETLLTGFLRIVEESGILLNTGSASTGKV